MRPALTLHARAPEELEAIDVWVVDGWFDGPHGPLDVPGTLMLSLEQTPDVDPRPGLPQRRNPRRTALYDEWDLPYVTCVLTVGNVLEIIEPPDAGRPLSNGVEFDRSGRLAIDDAVVLRVAELDLRLDVMAEVVRWGRRQVRRSGIAWERTD
jgi:hypothetical protein